MLIQNKVLMRIYSRFSNIFQVPYEYSVRRFHAKVGTENNFKPSIRNESLHQDSNDKGVKSRIS